MDSASTEEIILLIQSRQYEAALNLLEKTIECSDSPGLLGLIYYLQQNYEQAVKYLEEAVAINPGDPLWASLLNQSKQNLQSDVDSAPIAVTNLDPEYLFSKNKNYYPPDPGDHIPKKHWTQLLNILIGNTIGRISSWSLDHLTEFWGRIGGYKDKIWTNWYRRPLFLGVLSLAYMRNQLNRHNLFITLTSKEKDVYNELLKDAPVIKYYRTLNGTFNNPDNPIEGAAGTRFQRNVSPASSNPISDEQLLSPNPREISRALLTRKGPMKIAAHINLLAAAWIQFQNHDWVSHPESNSLDFISIDIAEDDPIRTKYHQSSLFVRRTAPDTTASHDSPFVHNYVNEVTHWWDGSQIYGSDIMTCARLRSHHLGKLKMSEGHTLPRDAKGQEVTGYNRNWWVGLSLFHTLFALEHNSICDALHQHYPDWDDDRLFHTARLINAALMAKIHTIEWNSAINPHPSIYKGNHANWYGLLTMLKKKKNWRTVAPINVRNTELGGVVGNPIKRFHSDFGLTEEFVEAYRIHSMLPECLEIRTMDSRRLLVEIPFGAVRYRGASNCIDTYGLQDLWYSLGNQNAGQVILNNYPRFMQELSIPGNPVYDMGAVDILRARERGVPRYNEFRRQLGLNPIHHLEDLTPDPEVIAMLKQLYGADAEAVERLDFMIGTLSEAHRPTGFAFGETMFQLFLLNATRRLQADRFYTDGYTEQYYTRQGMDWIDQNTLKSVLLRHYPDLQNTGLNNIDNAFEPWDESAILDPDRHPLRAFDADHKNDPWTGNTFRKNPINTVQT